MTETTNFIILGIFLSIVIGLIFCYLMILIKKRSLVKNAVKRIEKQKMKYKIGGRKYNFTGGDDDGFVKEKPIETKPEEPKTKKETKKKIAFVKKLPGKRKKKRKKK